MIQRVISRRKGTHIPPDTTVKAQPGPPIQHVSVKTGHDGTEQPSTVTQQNSGGVTLDNTTGLISIPTPMPAQCPIQQSFTKLGYGGVELPDTATQQNGWIMIRDNATGLIWENKTDDGTIHDKDNKYTWYDPNPETNGGCAGTAGDGTDTKDFIDAWNSANFGGYNDWRLPTSTELARLWELSKMAPKIRTAYFPNTNITMLSIYWSSTTLADYLDRDRARCVSFHSGYGGLGGELKWHYFCVRAVHGGQ